MGGRGWAGASIPPKGRGGGEGVGRRWRRPVAGLWALGGGAGAGPSAAHSAVLAEWSLPTSDTIGAQSGRGEAKKGHNRDT